MRFENDGVHKFVDAILMVSVHFDVQFCFLRLFYDGRLVTLVVGWLFSLFFHANRRVCDERWRRLTHASRMYLWGTEWRTGEYVGDLPQTLG